LGQPTFSEQESPSEPQRSRSSPSSDVQMGRAHRAVTDTAKLFGGHMGAAIVSVCFSGWMAHILPKNELVIFPLWITLSGLIQALSQFGMRDTLIRRVPEAMNRGDRAGVARMLRCGLVVNVFLAACLSSLLFMAAKLVAELFFDSAETVPLIRLVTLGVFCSVLRLHVDNGLSATQEFGRLALVNAFCRIAQAPMALAFYSLWGIEGAALALALVPAVGALLGLLRLWKHVSVGSGVSGFLDFMRYAVPFSGVGLLSFCSHRVDHFLVGALTTPDVWAGYYVAARLAEFLDQLGNFAIGAVNPKLAELRGRPQSEITAAFAKCTRYLVLGFVPICVAGIVLGPRLVVLYAGGKYAADGIIMSALCTYTLVSLFYAIHRGGILAFGARWHLLALQGCAAVLNPLCLVLFLRPWLGLGAAVGKICAFLALAVISYFILRLRVRPHYQREAMWLSLLANAVMFGCAGLTVILWPSPLAVLPAGAIGVLSYMAVLRRRLTAADARLVVGILPARLRDSARGVRLASKVQSFLAAPGQSE